MKPYTAFFYIVLCGLLKAGELDLDTDIIVKPDNRVGDFILGKEGVNLDAIYQINPESFNRLANLLLEILPSESDRKRFVNYEMTRGLEIQASSESKTEKYDPIVFFCIPEYFSKNQVSLVHKFQDIENKIHDIYKNVRTSDFIRLYNKSLMFSVNKQNYMNSQRRLEKLAVEIKTIIPGKDTLDSVISLLNRPDKRVNQNGFELITYRYEVKKEDQKAWESIPNLETLVTQSEYGFGDFSNKGDYVIAEIYCDAFGGVLYTSVLKYDGTNGSSSEIYRSGTKPSTVKSAS